MICGCNNQAKVIESLNTSETWDSSTILAMNLKKSMPAFDGDTLFISGFVYDIFVFEKTYGFPTVLSDIYKKISK